MDYIISIIIVLIYVLLIFFNRTDIILFSLLVVIIVVCIKNKLEESMMGCETIKPDKPERKIELIDCFIIVPFVLGWLLSSANYLLVGCILMVFATGVCFAKSKILYIIEKFKQKNGGEK